MSAVSLRTVSDYKPIPETTTNQKHTRLDLTTIEDAPRRGCLHRVASNINKVALPLAAVAMTAAMPTADGGPVSCFACIAVCESVAAAATVATAGAAAGSLIACVNSCWLLFPLPFCP